MQPLYKEQAAEPEYLEENLIELASKVFNTANHYISELAEQKKPLYQKLFDIYESEQKATREANRCWELLISKNATKEFKAILKFPREFSYSAPRHEANEFQRFLESKIHSKLT